MNEQTKKANNKRPKGRIIFSLFTVLFCLILGFFSLCGFFVPDREMSENENRVLAKMPSLTFHTLLDGSFMEDFETYLSDQFPFRDEAIYIKSFVERLWGKTKENGVYIGKNGYLFDSPTEYDTDKMSNAAKSINDFRKQNSDLNMVFTIVPNSSYIYGENLPDNLKLPDQEKQIEDFYGKFSENITTVDAVAALMNEKVNSNVFYKTDHHWTTRGAYSVFRLIAEKMKLTVKDENFEFHTVSNDFEGTLKSKSTFQKSVDSVEICFPKKSQGTYYFEISGKKQKKASFFYENKLEQKNKYEVFLGGNYAKLTVATTLTDGRKLLVIKDSFFNCMLPMLTPYFSKIVVLDPRYMTESVQTVLQEDDFTDVLFLYNANTFFADTSLVSVLENTEKE